MTDERKQELAWLAIEALIFKGPENEGDLHNLSILLDPNPSEGDDELMPTVINELVNLIADNAEDMRALLVRYTLEDDR